MKLRFFRQFHSPIGLLTLVANENSVIELSWDKKIESDDQHPVLDLAQKQLQEYFNGKRKQFDLPLTVTGSVFKKNIWKALQLIPYGKTISYLELAHTAGFPKAYRAAGTACGKNPVPIIIPCHRVIAQNGTLGGFSGDINIKKFLLALEKKEPPFMNG